MRFAKKIIQDHAMIQFLKNISHMKEFPKKFDLIHNNSIQLFPYLP